MNHKIKNNKRRINLSFFKKNSATWLMAFVLLGVHVFLAVQNSAMGANIAFLEEEVQTLERGNESLSMDLIDSTSLTKLGQISEELGYQKIENTLYLRVGDAFAKAQ
jgi:hypothetical protein